MNLIAVIKTCVLFLLSLFLVACATIAGPEDDQPPPGVPVPGAYAVTNFYDRYVQGKPDIDLRLEGGIYIWRNGNAWSVRVARRMGGARENAVFGPVYSGTVQFDRATVVDVKRRHISPPGNLLSRQNEIAFKIEQGDTIGNDIEGFDFRVRPTGLDYCVMFDFLKDGAARPDMVRLGSFRHKIEELPLRICLHSRD